MTRGSIPYKTLDDRTFAVRMRIKVGGQGLRCLNEIHDYLRAAGSYAIHSDQGGIYIYANEPKMVVDCVEKFDLKLLSFKKETP
jgi:hypothetical protein